MLTYLRISCSIIKKKKSLNTAHDHNSASTNNVHFLILPREIFLECESTERNVMRPQILKKKTQTKKKRIEHIFLTLHKH